ncbi:hypothetical protein SEVIR_1G207600v4 [Setaria viridis]|uniref:Uncharacterized protein n=1 Tax=Setaria viridis TaxID=4556 RepID=A0A4U6WB70_SETVI|nr:cingulin-like [Setaria viridis]TKW39861.1 hypothetical protein SEVIR_1G207600v2 [Setaria viridis]
MDLQPMQPPPSSRARSRSWGAGPWATAPPLSPRQQMKPRHERSRSTTPTYSPPVPSSQSLGDSGGMTEQAPETTPQEDELCRPATETETEGKAARPAGQQPAERQVSDGADAGMERVVRRLEREVAAAKQTEMKMLESLVRQTKELEQAKIALEEARLEVDALRQQQQGAAAAGPAPPAQQQQWSVMDLMFGGVDEELNGLRARLRASSQAEERSRKAADDLTAALSAVTMEAKQVKAWLSDAQAELEAANAEADRLRGLLLAAEAELWSATEQADAITTEWKDAAAGWRAREKALVARASAAEEEAAAARRENADLAGARRALDDENDGLRRALERAAEDASAATEALELVSGENAGLREAADEKERDLEDLRRENGTLRAGEAAARERAKELEAQLLAAATATDGSAAIGKAAVEIPLVEKWRREAAQGKLGAAAFLDHGRVLPGRRDRMFASLSNLAELKSAAAAAAMDDYDYEFDHLDVGHQYAGGGATEHAMKHRKRRSILRKFGDLFRRRSLYKPDPAPVLHNHY